MRKEIENFLRNKPGVKARELAKELGLARSEVSRFLHENRDRFCQSEDYGWTLVTFPEFRIKLPEDAWVDCDSFEQALAHAGSPIDAGCESVVFVVPKDCKILLEAAARLMALCNQLAWMNKSVAIDFGDSHSTLTYLNRVGFFDHLNATVNVLPRRPTISGAATYKGNNNKVVEFGAIDPVEPDETIPEQLKESFVTHASSVYAIPAFTVISELFGNVRDHSESPILGFIALQYYKSKTPHIQTVISDSGKGIVGTLRPILQKRYPQLAKKFDPSNPTADVLLVKEVFQKGNISQIDEVGRGLGLKRSNDMAAKFNAKILVRQEIFEVKLRYRSGVLDDFSYALNRPRILGTHICFDFFLDA